MGTSSMGQAWLCPDHIMEWLRWESPHRTITFRYIWSVRGKVWQFSFQVSTYFEARSIWSAQRSAGRCVLRRQWMWKLRDNSYALDMPHDGWRALLPYYVTMYKSNITTITQEVLSIWYRTFPAASVACSDGLTTGNTASQLLLEFSPREVVQDKIF